MTAPTPAAGHHDEHGRPADSAGQAWQGKSIPSHGFSGDEGGADAILLAALAAARGRVSWRKRPDLLEDLETHRAMLVDRLARTPAQCRRVIEVGSATPGAVSLAWAQAVASVLAQEVDGPFELILALGPSTDGTDALAIEQLTRRLPDFVGGA